MLKALIRFALIWVLSLLLTPYVNRFLDRLAAKAPEGSFIQDLLYELSERYSSALITAVGETVGELVFGSKK
jgi:hypothetical protein